MDEGARRLLSELRRDVRDERVLEAVAAVPRELFVPEGVRGDAWLNIPLPIGEGQTISQPLVVARMCELVAPQPTDRVLDVGTGSGYHAALLARLAGHVWSVERHAALARVAARNLEAAGIDNVTLLVGDGAAGVPEAAPFDVVNVAAAGTEDQLATLEGQLAEGGRLIAPVGTDDQRLVLTRRRPGGELVRESLERVRFVPLVRVLSSRQ